MSVRLRSVQGSDLEWIISSQTKEYGADLAPHIELTVRAWWTQHLSDPSIYEGLIAFKDQDPIGSVFCELKAHDYTLRISMLFVQPTFRGMGIAKQLMSQAEVVAKKHCARYVELDTSTSTREMYERMGYGKVVYFESTVFGCKTEIWTMRKRL